MCLFKHLYSGKEVEDVEYLLLISPKVVEKDNAGKYHA